VTEALRYLLLAYVGLYVATAFVGRSYLFRRRTGTSPYVVSRAGDVRTLVSGLFTAALVACCIVVALHALWPRAYVYVVPISWLDRAVLDGAGLGLLVISWAWTLLAQRQMGGSWRIGIDAEHHTELVQTGLFRVSRNPIFLGMRVMLLGFFLVLPSAAMLAILTTGDAVMQVQARLEEEHLAQRHGPAFAEYRRRTRRWL
jgi:protein-S-isoprenylcysteine O-methyltransferase Ste14